MKTHILQRKIMRRVYHAFALRVVTHPVIMKIGLFMLALLVFAKLVHVSKVLENIFSTTVGQAPGHLFNIIFNAALAGEVLTLLAIGVMVFVALSLPRNVVQLFRPSHTLVAI